MAKENPWKQINDDFSALCDKKGEPMYKSPISIYETAMQTIMEQRENAIVAKVQDAFDVQVDKDELIRALKYDRGQYEAGYKDGKAAAMDEKVLCKDCVHGSHVDTPEGRVWCEKICRYMLFEGYCSYGERR